MANYLTNFKEISQYETYIKGSPLLPNVTLVDEDYSVRYVHVTSIVINNFSYSPNIVDATGGTATPIINYTIKYSDGRFETTGGTISYIKNSGVATMDSNGVLTWTMNTTKNELTTNVSVIVTKGGVSVTLSVDNKQKIMHEVGDICYYDTINNILAYTPYTSWTSSLGIALAVCVIPTSHNVYGNQDAGFMSIKGVTTAGTESNTDIQMSWGGYEIETPLTNYTQLPLWDNSIPVINRNDGYGYISSDRTDWKDNQNVIDKVSYYSNISESDYLTFSPYASDGSFYSNYRRTISGNNVLSDFNGASNTSTLAATGNTYIAANACHLYSANTILSAGTWYLPAMGELGYIMPRFNVINTALSKVEGALLNGDYGYWSSTEFGSKDSYVLHLSYGLIGPSVKYGGVYMVRPFVSLS